MVLVAIAVAAVIELETVLMISVETQTTKTQQDNKINSIKGSHKSLKRRVMVIDSNKALMSVYTTKPVEKYTVKILCLYPRKSPGAGTFPG